MKIVSSVCQLRLLNPQHWTFKYHQAATLITQRKGHNVLQRAINHSKRPAEKIFVRKYFC